MTRRLLPVAFAVMLVACAQDDPRIGGSDPAATLPAPTSPLAATIPITAVEYEFQGVPDRLPEGVYTFAFKNAGEEKHEFYLFYIPGEQTIEELLDLSQRQLSKTTEFIDSAIAPPGQPGEFTAALVPGRFGYVCFVPAQDGTPHAFLGMVGELTVA